MQEPKIFVSGLTMAGEGDLREYIKQVHSERRCDKIPCMTDTAILKGRIAMDYKYNTINEINHFEFGEAVVGDIQMADGMFHIVLDNVKIKPENSRNRDIRTMRANGLFLKLGEAEIVALVKEGYREFDADGNLKHVYEDVTVEKEQYGQTTEVLIEGTVYELKLEKGVYCFVIDATNDRTYLLKVAACGDEEYWNRFLEV